MAVQQRAGGACGCAQPGMEAGRIEPARRLDHDPAMVAVGADLLPLARARHQADAVGPLAERRDWRARTSYCRGLQASWKRPQRW